MLHGLALDAPLAKPGLSDQRDQSRHREAVLVGQPQFFANHITGFACDTFKRLRFAPKEERRIAKSKAKLLADRC